MVKFVEEKLNMDSPAVLAVLAVRKELELQGDETKQVSEMLQVIKTVVKRSTTQMAVKDATAAVIDKFCNNGDRQESFKPVMRILQENFDHFKVL